MYIPSELTDEQYVPIEHSIFKEFYYIPSIPRHVIYKYTLEIGKITINGDNIILKKPTNVRGIHQYIALKNKDGAPISFNLQLLYVFMFKRELLDLHNLSKYSARYPKYLCNSKQYDPEIIQVYVSESRTINRPKYDRSSVDIYTEISNGIDDSLTDPQYKPVPHPLFQGFFFIPGYSKYLINPTTLELMSIINPSNPKLLKWNTSVKGYKNVAIINDKTGCRKLMTRHRLLASMFKRDNIDVTKINSLIPNHLNSTPGDDRLENLKWSTTKYNVLYGFTDNGRVIASVPLSIRNVDTGEIMKFPSIKSCADYLNYSSDIVNKRINEPEIIVYPDRLQFRKGHADTDWDVPEDIDLYLLSNSKTKSIDVKNVVTGEIATYPSNQVAAEKLGIAPTTLSHWLDKPGQPIFLLPNKSFVQLKYSWDESNWRHVDNYLADYQDTNQVNRLVVVTDESTNTTKIYLSAVECAKDLNILTTTLNWRLKSGGTKVYSDGRRYRYYDPNQPIDLQSVQLF